MGCWPAYLSQSLSWLTLCGMLACLPVSVIKVINPLWDAVSAIKGRFRKYYCRGGGEGGSAFLFWLVKSGCPPQRISRIWVPLPCLAYPFQLLRWSTLCGMLACLLVPVIMVIIKLSINKAAIMSAWTLRVSTSTFCRTIFAHQVAASVSIENNSAFPISFILIAFH